MRARKCLWWRQDSFLLNGDKEKRRFIRRLWNWNVGMQLLCDECEGWSAREVFGIKYQLCLLASGTWRYFDGKVEVKLCGDFLINWSVDGSFFYFIFEYFDNHDLWQFLGIFLILFFQSYAPKNELKSSGGKRVTNRDLKMVLKVPENTVGAGVFFKLCNYFSRGIRKRLQFFSHFWPLIGAGLGAKYGLRQEIGPAPKRVHRQNLAEKKSYFQIKLEFIPTLDLENIIVRQKWVF